ncbi:MULTISPECIES: diacylglycerol kinase [Desulfosediminicola]|uniref:diacylglycerol kinase n=1 Tax=Desulfosediminicola TaxID=2886823 RepID=UPI0010ACED4B|nr:diacylglycerol kinase [Desulfosediminicola ganghwensis]
MKNKFSKSDDGGYHPLQKVRVVLSGLKYAVRYDFSVTYKLVLSAIVLSTFFFFRQWIDFLLLAAATTMMLMAELFNSAIEALCDFITTKESHKVKVIKDISAAAAGICIFFWAVILVIESYRILRFLF